MKKMKSTIISLALCALCAAATAQTVTVADVEALPGETVALTLNLTGGKANTYTAMQFDAHFPATGFATTGKYSVSELWENATATIGSVDANGVATIPVASSESISAADVDGLLSVSFTVGGDVPIGEYDVTLKNLWFGYGTSSKDYLDDVTFKVKVVAVHTVVLDENSTKDPEAATGVNVRVKRTISANQWSTICLPFSMTAAQCQEAFGDDVELADFTGCDVDDTTNDIRVNFSNVTAIEANHPYIIKVSAPVTAFTVDGVDIAPEDEPSINKDKSGRRYNSFIGTYVAETVVPDYCLFLSDNQFWFSTGKTKMKAFRGYFDLDAAGAEYEDAEVAARITMVFVEGETTGIGNLTPALSKGDGVYYNLRGQQVAAPSKGLYIKGRRKIVVK